MTDTTIHVDDSLETDIADAIPVGIESVWISNSGSAEGHSLAHQNDSMSGFLALPWIDESIFSSQ